eukprot:1665217-Pleurochrysis_carterae.AAC.3
MVSPEKEVVPFTCAVDPNEGDKKGNVELWLSEVETAMRATLRAVFDDALAAYKQPARAEWVMSWPGQVALNGSQVFWTSEVEAAISKAAEMPNALAQYRATLDAQLQQIVVKVRKRASALHASSQMAALFLFEPRPLLAFFSHWLASFRESEGERKEGERESGTHAHKHTRLFRPFPARVSEKLCICGNRAHKANILPRGSE